MIYKDRSVPIPEGKIVISREYVYLTLESTYMPEKNIIPINGLCLAKHPMVSPCIPMTITTSISLILHRKRNPFRRNLT